ncbi:hypothetical protein [Bradyrhizobium sp. STM 3557]
MRGQIGLECRDQIGRICKAALGPIVQACEQHLEQKKVADAEGFAIVLA